MASETDVEKGGVRGHADFGSDSTYHAKIEKAESESNTVEEDAMRDPDLDHEKVEQMDPAHRDDLLREHVGSLSPSSIDLILTSIGHNCIDQSRPSRVP